MNTRLTVCLYTHMRHPERLVYAKRAVISIVLGCLETYAGPGRIHVADDNSRPEMLEELLGVIRGCGHEPTVSHGMGRGYGASHNAATQVIHNFSDVLLPLEDDWELTRKLPVERLMGYFENEAVRSIRLGYLGWTQPIGGRLVKAAGDTCLMFDPMSNEPHVNAGHPRLETVAYQRAVGPWAEGVDAGATEFDWCMRRSGRDGVVWPMDVGLTASQGSEGAFFHHIGAVQAREDQVQSNMTPDGKPAIGC